jgi:chromosome partitioning protein
MKIISFLNNKGGVGKTATTSTIAHMIATIHKKRVLLIDVDPQGNLSSIFSQTQVIDLLVSLLKDMPVTTPEKTVEDLFMNANMDIHECIRKTEYKNLDIIPSLLTLSECEEALKADIRTPQQFRLKNHLNKIQDEYDYCLIDCSPSINILNINALVASDQVYIPLKCDAWSATGMCIAKKLVKTVQSYNNQLQLAGCFFTQWEGVKNVSKTTYEILEQIVPDLLLPITISKSKLIEEMSYMQKPLLEYDTSKEKSKVTKDYIKLTKYIVSH